MVKLPASSSTETRAEFQASGEQPDQSSVANGFDYVRTSDTAQKVTFTWDKINNVANLHVFVAGVEIIRIPITSYPRQL